MCFVPNAAYPITSEIGLSASAVAAPIYPRSSPEDVDVYLEAVELVGELEPGASFVYFTFNGTVPGPMIRVMVGDSVNIHFTNLAANTMEHSVDFHAVTGPGGGASLTHVQPGQTLSFHFKALVPGVYVYHCASPNVPTHISKGMYGLIVVEPPGGLSPVDAEFYLMQGEIYASTRKGTPGHILFDTNRLLQEDPSHVVFNGRVGSLTDPGRSLNAATNSTVRVFMGVGGPSLASSFHVIGCIFHRLYSEGGLMTAPNLGVQTTTVAPGGATVVEIDMSVPGKFLIVDHALTRTFNKGAQALLVASGPANTDIFGPLP